ncbi:thioredoxin family protein [Natrialba sp. SSL1]|uniref:thioredoxin family protein n=1 Tax=Natrialba sp. SSL1 TaxID=1869245 RepID=UPI0008F85C50|nr:thioredoxin domain-containing protein [Natrialba sp. SSL1]OIB56083.1 thiol reductase thioredoxin [Natrialba sp. SSL1]
MSESLDDEREQIREQKRRELQHRLENGEAVGAGDDTDSTAGTTPSPSEPIEIDGADHLDEVITNHDIVLVDCYAEWCGPCQMMEPTIGALAAESAAAVAAVDVDQHQHLAQQLGARGVPTLVLYADGEPVERLVGAQDQATLESLIAQHG